MAKWVYLALAVVGAVIPFYFFFPYIQTGSLDLGSMLNLLFANPISTFFAVDLIISVLAFWLFLFKESDRIGMRYPGAFVLATVFVGLSFALPLFLFFRQRKIDRG